LRAVAGISSLRTEPILRALHRHIAAACARGRHIVHFSLQDDHLHNIIEAADREVVARTIQGFASILARAFNRVLARKGQLWEERYHRHDLKTPTEVHHALGYVLQNFRKHAVVENISARMASLDPFSSAAWFDGWDEDGQDAARRLRAWLEERGFRRCTAEARTFLLRVGWAKIGKIAGQFVPRQSLRARFARA
jgi:putative transposase